MSQRLPSEIFVPPLPSFPIPVTPPVDGSSPVAICIPEAWLPYVRGAMQQLIQAKTWKGTEEEIATAQTEAATIIAQMESGACAVQEAPTPFWDEDADVDDAEPADMQPWYGTVSDPEAAPAELDFVENFAVWTITGFLAVATIEVGAAPAILFNTIAPRFVLATKRGDLGEIIRILVDGEEAARVDTSGYAAGEVIRTNIIADPALSTHDVMIVQVS